MFGNRIYRNEEEDQRSQYAEKIAEQFTSEFNQQQQNEIVFAIFKNVLNNYARMLKEAQVAFEEAKCQADFHAETLNDLLGRIDSLIRERKSAPTQ